jgi:hypothetical protein
VVSLFSTHLCFSHVELPSGDGDGEGAVAAYSEQKRLPRRGGAGSAGVRRVVVAPSPVVLGAGRRRRAGLGSVYLYQMGQNPPLL